MLKFIGKRLAYAILTLFLIATATFFPGCGGRLEIPLLRK